MISKNCGKLVDVGALLVRYMLLVISIVLMLSGSNQLHSSREYVTEIKNMQPIKVYDSVVSMDHGQFYLYSTNVIDFDAVKLIDEAQNNGESIASDGLLMVVLTPQQHNFNMPLKVELWESQPESDLNDWDEVFEASIVIVDNVLIYDTPEGTDTAFEIPNGRYNMTISGKGFSGRGWVADPEDSWRIQLWENSAPTRYRRLKKY